MEFLKIIMLFFIMPVVLYFIINLIIDWLITFLPSEVIFGLMIAIAGGMLYYFYKKEVE